MIKGCNYAIKGFNLVYLWWLTENLKRLYSLSEENKFVSLHVLYIENVICCFIYEISSCCFPFALD